MSDNTAGGSYNTTITDPIFYCSASVGGSFPFNENGNLIISSRPSIGRDILFVTNNGSNVGPRMSISRNGNVGIGTTNPTAKLQVAGDFYLETANSKILWGTSTANPYISAGLASSQMAIMQCNVGIGRTDASHLLDMEASGGGYYSSTDHQWHNGSSKKIKKNIKNVSSSVLDILDSVNIKEYHYKNEIDTDKKHLGFIAEETPDILTGKGKDGQAIGDCIGFLLAVVKELNNKINNFKMEAIKK
jgi:hypothetical protein